MHSCCHETDSCSDADPREMSVAALRASSVVGRLGPEVRRAKMQKVLVPLARARGAAVCVREGVGGTRRAGPGRLA